MTTTSTIDSVRPSAMRHEKGRRQYCQRPDRAQNSFQNKIELSAPEGHSSHHSPGPPSRNIFRSEEHVGRFRPPPDLPYQHASHDLQCSIYQPGRPLYPVSLSSTMVPAEKVRPQFLSLQRRSFVSTTYERASATRRKPGRGLERIKRSILRHQLRYGAALDNRAAEVHLRLPIHVPKLAPWRHYDSCGRGAASHTASIKRRTALASQSILSIGSFQYWDVTYAA
jgi:hypothetical protein